VRRIQASECTFTQTQTYREEDKLIHSRTDHRCNACICWFKIKSKSLCKKAFKETETVKEYDGGRERERERERERKRQGGRESVRKTVKERETQREKEARRRGRKKKRI